MADQAESVRNSIPRSSLSEFLLICSGGAMLPMDQAEQFALEGPKYDLRNYAAEACGKRD